MEFQSRFLTLIFLCSAYTKSVFSSPPMIIPSNPELLEETGAIFREILISDDGIFAYIGAKDRLIKINLESDSTTDGEFDLSHLPSDLPGFPDRTTERNWWTTISYLDEAFFNYPPIEAILLSTKNLSVRAAYRRLDRNFFIRDIAPEVEVFNLKYKISEFIELWSLNARHPLRGNSALDTVLEYSTIYQSMIPYKDQCLRQAKLLNLYYGRGLQMRLSDTELLCGSHFRGLTTLHDGSIFAVKSGLFGTMPLSGGTNDYSEWLEFQDRMFNFVYCLIDKQPTDTCFTNDTSNAPYDKSLYNGNLTEAFGERSVLKLATVVNPKSHVMVSPENYMGKRRLCDSRPAPNRVIITTNFLLKKNESLVGDSEKDPCKENGSLAQLFLGGYHPDQSAFSYFSAEGNGPSGRNAIYVLAEIGQEKQMDLMTNYLNLPEWLPVSSSASLSMVRLLIDDKSGDVDPKSMLLANPFKYTWITSPLNRFSRMDKSTSNEQVPYLPKPVGIHEHGDYIYFFFREADWENTPSTPYSIRREHFTQFSYSHSLYHPWEKAFIDTERLKYEEKEPGSEPNKYEELYNSPRLGFKHKAENLKVTGRVARVCKNDTGLPLGLTDVNLYDLDNRLSLNVFQTFRKSRLVCRVPVAGVPFVWRLKEDVYRLTSEECTSGLLTEQELYGKDYHFRQMERDDYVSVLSSFKKDPTREETSRLDLPYFFLTHCKSYKWSYARKPITHSALYVEYPELRDYFVIGERFYGVFSSQFASEHQYTDETTNSNVKATPSTALCSFTMAEILSTFDGPFKKKDSTGGSYRPFDPRKEGEAISPSPYSDEEDVSALAAAAAITRMNLDFLDPTQPYSEEIRHIDIRRNSTRLSFFEEDINGTRTMWNDVETTAMLTASGIFYTKIVGKESNDSVSMYAATNEGKIHKIVSRQLDKKCFVTNGTAFAEWLNTTASMSSIWDNELYAYFNRTIDQVTFSASFKSHLTLEKNTQFPEDVLFRSDWECTPESETKVVAIYTPFETPTAIRDLKLSKTKLVIATDDKVVSMPIDQCSSYLVCSDCRIDTSCGWDNSKSSCILYSKDVISSINPSSKCEPTPEHRKIDLNTDVILPSNLKSSTVLNDYFWTKNSVAIEYRPRRLMQSSDNSLVIFNFFDHDSGVYDLKSRATSERIVSYNLTLSDCSEADCQYKLKYRQWCDEFDTFRENMVEWEKDYKSSDGYCQNVP